MEVPKMEDETNKSHLTSPAAFVEGGIQEACEDSCSICLEDFCDNDPKTVTSCKHEFHIQCILEWCQRSSNCPMCWQAVSLKDPSSQELLEAVVQERRARLHPTRSSAIFHHPTLGDFEIQNLPVGFNGSELEDRIIQHLAAAAAMGRAYHVSRREGSRNRVSMSHSQYGPTMSVSGGLVQEPVDPVAEPAAVDSARAPASFTSGGGGSVQHVTTSGMVDGSNSQHGTTVIVSSRALSSLPDQDRAGPSEVQAASDTWKSRFSAFSTRYKESLSKSTRGWKDKLFNKNPSILNTGSEVRTEANTGIDSMIERLDVRENSRQNHNHDDGYHHDSSSSNLALRATDARSSHNRVGTVGTAGVSGSN